ncbi:MAG: hypothetical protein KJN67_04890 [Pontiella sp.]|nr:hypothetical protein [Pontiella sp.]NNJ70802.1 hypothetical protein [Kiritimatiellales bacterium]
MLKHLLAKDVATDPVERYNWFDNDFVRESLASLETSSQQMSDKKSASL